jgi:AcrR family transcriptional regulator
MGMRERKKLRTREALIAAAMELFASRGYRGTTVNDIAAAADMSPRTFFLHFAAKEDLVIADAQERISLGVQVIEERRPDEGPLELLARAVDRMVTHTLANDLVRGQAQMRVHLIMTVPELRARLLERFTTAQDALCDSLCSTFPELDPLAVAVVVGRVVGAVTAAAATSVRRADTPERVAAVMRWAAEAALEDAQVVLETIVTS